MVCPPNKTCYLIMLSFFFNSDKYNSLIFFNFVLFLLLSRLRILSVSKNHFDWARAGIKGCVNLESLIALTQVINANKTKGRNKIWGKFLFVRTWDAMTDMLFWRAVDSVNRLKILE